MASPTLDDRIEAYVSAASNPENVAILGDENALQTIVAAGPRGAWALAGLTVGLLLAIWLAFFVFVFLPRGAVG
jgi:hypothetical protein